MSLIINGLNIIFAGCEIKINDLTEDIVQLDSKETTSMPSTQCSNSII